MRISGETGARKLFRSASDQTELRLFTTWYPTDYKFPYLMSDHVYEMSAHQSKYRI